MRLTDDIIQDVRNSASIVNVIGHYVPLIKKGKSFTCLCPFHDDHTPSLSISEDKQIYKCFVCGNGGNVFTFVQNFENVSFPEAVVKVAEISGKPIDIDVNINQKPIDLHLQSLYNVLNETIKYTKYILTTKKGLETLEYLNKRGIDNTIIDEFDIGFNDPSDNLYKFLSAKGYNEADMLETNIIRLSESGIHDVFSNRITFPIHDSIGNPVGFTARTMAKDTSKYINTSETELYIKGKILYNYHRAKQSAKKLGFVLVCEGVIDVIAFARAGIKNVVATLGTACTVEQIKLFKQCCDTVVFCYDGDEAGQNATYKACKIAMSAGLKVNIVKNTTGLDPDEIISKYNVEELKLMSSNRLTWIQFVFEFLKRRYNLSNYAEKKEFAKHIQIEIDLLDDDFDRQNFQHELYLLTGFKMNPKKQYENKAVKNYESNSQIKTNVIVDGITSAEYLVLSQMILSRKACDLFKEKLGFLLNDVNQKLAMIIIDNYRKTNQIKVNELIDIIKEDETKQTLINLSLIETMPKEYDEKQLIGALRKIKAVMLEEKVNDLKEQIKNINNPESQSVLMIELSNLQLERRRIIDEE